MGRSALAGLIALLVFLATLAPGVTSEDSGELAAAAALWGVPHPPGFPLWVLLARAAVAVSPAPAVVAVGVASAVFGAALVFVLAELSRSLGASPEAAGVGALLVGLGQTFWSQAIIVEVYTLNALLLGLTLLFVVRWGKEAQDKYLFAAALCWGLGLANHHPLTLLTGPGFAIYVLLRGGSQILQPGRFLRVIGFAVAPLALYLYLPVAAHFAPPINWGQPDSLAALWAHISRSSYSSLELSETVSWADKKSFLLHFVGLWSEEFTLWILVPGLALGVFALRQRHPKELILLLVVMAFNSLVLLAILRFRFTHENVMRVNEYFLPTYAATGVILAVGFDQLVRIAPKAVRAVLVIALLALPAAAAANRWEDVDKSEYYLAEDFNRAVFSSLPRDAVFFTSGDYVSFPCLYLQAVEQVRPDVLLANYTGDPSPELLAYLRALDDQFEDEDALARQRLLLRKGSRPVIFAAKSDVRAEGFRLEPWGLVYRAWRPGETIVPGPDIRDEPILRNLKTPTSVDDLGRSILGDYHRAMAEHHLRAKEEDAALRELQLSVEYSSQSKKGLNNLGSMMAEYGRHADAMKLYRQAAEIDAQYVTPRRNLAMLYDRLGRRPEAITAFSELVRAAPEDNGAARRLATLQARQTEIEQRVRDFEAATQRTPGHAPLWNNLGTAYMEAGRPKDALSAYLEAIRIDPKYALAHKHLASLYLDVLRDERKAQEHRDHWQALLRSPQEALSP